VPSSGRHRDLAQSLRGNRYKLRAVGLSEKDMNLLGVMPAGE